MAKMTEVPVELEVRSIIWPTLLAAMLGGIIGGIIGSLI